MDTCTSSLCSWNHSTKEVPKYFTYIAVAKNILFLVKPVFLGTLSFMVKIAANDVWLIVLIVLQKMSMKLNKSVVKMIVGSLLAIPPLPAVPPPATHVIQPPQAVPPLAAIPLPAT